MKKFNIITVILFLFAVNLTAQTKNEKESRIKLEMFPEQAQALIKTVIEDVKRIRHYEEVDGKNLSYESKFKYKKHWFSVEFDNSGNLEDIEVTIKERHLENSVRVKINSYLNSQFTKYDFLKIQEQYISENNDQGQNLLFKVLENKAEITSNYEVVVAVKTNDNWEIKEMTFDSLGIFLNERIIQQDSYEYILY